MEKGLDKSEEVISGMFDSIASKYDRMNHAMSLGIDKLWRKRFVRSLSGRLPEGASVLDLACGTADLTIALSQKGFRLTGLDISREMVEVGKAKCSGLDPQPSFIIGSADEIPFPDGSFDAVTIAFGLRNFDRREECLAEIRRVLKNGGTLAVLEFALPRDPLWRAIYLLYFRTSMRLMGRAVGSPGAYGYLVDSVLAFPRYEALCHEFESAGLTGCSYRSYSGGIAVAYTAIK